MVDRGGSGKCVGKHRSSASSKSSCSSSEFDQEYREHLEGKYLGSGVEVRPPSGTNHQQPGSHLSIDTRLSELSLGCHDHVIDAGNDGLSSQSQSASSKNTSKVNCYITSPFKQGYNVPKSEPHKPIIDPSIELKRVTKDSIARVRQQFRKPKPPPPPSLYSQRLRKAKIKSTGRPISGSGPSIQQCKGVQAGRRVINRTAAPLVYFKDDRPLTGSSFTRPERPTEMHRPDSSIHCTSRASSIEDRNSFLDECFDNDPACDSRDNVLDTVDQHPSCDHAGTCKPFSDAKYHSHDDDDDHDITHSKALLSNYNSYFYNHNVTSQDSNEFKAYSGTGKSKTKMGNQASMLTDDCLHVVDSTPGDDTPVLTVHVRTKLDSTAAAPLCDSIDSTPNNICESYDKIDFEKDDDSIQMRSHSDDDCNGDDNDDDNDLDIDRIPSAVIWNNLDQLNLSMNASSSQYKDNLNSNTRQVQSAGHCRDTSTVCSVINGEKFERNKQSSRTSSSKSRKTKKNSAKPHEDIGKVELLHKYLSEESQKFCADLPGYFTEQFHIIQEAKKTLTGVLKCQQDVSTALVKYEGEEDTTSDAIKSTETDLQEIDDNSTSFGVFFTVDSTSTCDVDSMSVSSHDSIPAFSDDTGFETMPSVDISQHGQNTTQHSDQVRFVKPEDLEVVAKAKLLTDPKLSNAQYMNNCPHEPLKFLLNAKAPPGYLFYFAYGVDMNTKRMSLYLRREHKRLWGVLFGFKLRFNKKGSSFEAGGFANVEYCAGSSVEGCIYTITDEELSMLDNCMGYPKHYTRIVLPVWMSNCHQPSLHGVAQYCVPAVVYVAEQQWIQPGPADIFDSMYSIGQCLKASDILSPNYVEYLNQLAA